MTQLSVRAAFERATTVLSARPDLAKKPSAFATAVLGEKLSCRITGPGGESAGTALPATFGGEGNAPSPGWFLRAAIASCAASGIGAQALLKAIDLERVEVTVTCDTDARGALGIGEVTAAMTDLKMSVVLSSKNASASQLEELVRWVEAHSPVSCTIGAGRAPLVEVQIVPSTTGADAA